MSAREAAKARAGEAFHAACRDDMAAAVRAVEALAAEQGPDAVVEAIVLWLDTLLVHGFGHRQDEFVPSAAVVFARDDEHEARFADGSQPPEVVWGGRMLAARAAGDEDTFIALLEAAMSGDEAAWGRHVITLLQSTAMTYRAVRAARTS